MGRFLNQFGADIPAVNAHVFHAVKYNPIGRLARYLGNHASRLTRHMWVAKNTNSIAKPYHLTTSPFL